MAERQAQLAALNMMGHCQSYYCGAVLLDRPIEFHWQKIL